MNRIGFGIQPPYSGSFEKNVLNLSMENYIPDIKDFFFTIGDHPQGANMDMPTTIKEFFTGTELKEVLEKNGFKIVIEKIDRDE